jgi:hypothetical protein
MSSCWLSLWKKWWKFVIDFKVKPVMNSKCLILAGSFALVTCFVLLLCSLLFPIWETNDDVAMSMIAHGYGIASSGSPPTLMFSNVLWGYFVRFIPEVNGVLGYSIATMGTLVVVGAFVVNGLFRLGVSYLGCLSVLVLLLARPTLFPQFTINSGFLMVAAFVCWHLYERERDFRMLVYGCVLAFFSYMIRSHEFLLVLLVAWPLLRWKKILLLKQAKISFVVLALAVAVAAFIDHRAYQGDEWGAFSELNPARAPFTDFGAAENLKQRQDILSHHGYSSNDVSLIENWFFVDSVVAKPQVLQAMLDELGAVPTQDIALGNGWLGIQVLWHPVLLVSVLAALSLLLIRPSWRLAVSWGLCVSAMFAFGLLGRPGILRVYVPLVGLLLIAPFFTVMASGWRKKLSVAIPLVAALITVVNLYPEVEGSKNRIVAASESFHDFPDYPIVVWGVGVPFEAIYPVMGAATTAMQYQFYGLGVSTLAPFSVAFSETAGGRGMVDKLLDKTGVPVISSEKMLEYLDIYCGEHHGGVLKYLSAQQFGPYVLNRVRCEILK